ncbi:MAG: DNA-binding response regulator [Bacteroidetes bacterium GWC2_33_15]|nr:MAG: DNA-binding response regulator [Bacteroidetes bacterium GWA2_33_15]OFX51868.1 MAG: DNA-binding response regulator [Bacteroidetes bacterium GWC2_33_15]OFX63436.1 MAG: DNA-binding response regulator [Bacteroidetes bacterium GWB2_32_14]OFX67216.1 MAG: DNA-binding response regulator [Bacteroidetes bacterium GWD2_33_33]HAN17059.1 DNA-binding response regulator [Bacteroidales bacterium]
MVKHKVILVDDHSLFRNGLKLLLNNSGKVTVVGEASNGQEFLDLVDGHKDSIVFMDIEMPVKDGIETTRDAIQKYPDMKIIALTMFGENEYYLKMIEAGVKGFLLKNSEIDEVLNTIDTVAQGENCFSRELLLSIVKNIHSQEKKFTETILSEREIEILHFICKGFSNQEISEKLFISKRTVDKHRSNIIEKTGSKNTASLVMYAIKNGIIEV